MSEWRPEGWDAEDIYAGAEHIGMTSLGLVDAGADAMLAALRAGGKSLMKADVSEVARTLFKGMTQRGTWVFIPDEEK